MRSTARLLSFLASSFFLLPPLRAQAPHACFQAFHFTGAAQIQLMADNLQTLCNNFVITYSAQGFATLSMVVQDAPDAGNTPGTWVTYAGTVNTGVNPNTSIVAASTNLTGFFRWIRVNLTAVTGTGTVDGVIYGDQVAPGAGASAGGGGCTGTVATPCIIGGKNGAGTAQVANVEATSGSINTVFQTTGVDAVPNASLAQLLGNNVPVVPEMAPYSFNGASWDRSYVCTLTSIFDTSAAGNTLLVAASGSTKIRICRWSAQDVGTGNTIQLQQGTGATCAGGTTGLWMIYVKISTIAEDFPYGPLVAAASNAVCINLVNATRVTGVIQYVQF
jgi:hypothetical protein